VHELFKTHKRFSRSYEKIGISEAPLKVQRSALVLKHQRRVRDQRGLGNLQRSINMRNSMKLSIGRGRTDFLTGNCAVSSASLLRGFRDGGEDDSTLKTALVILDDVVTTGASVTEALRAVRCAGYHPDMVLSFAASVGGFKKEGKS